MKETIEFAETEHRSDSVFPSEWGTAPDDREQRAAWIEEKVSLGMVAARSGNRPGWLSASAAPTDGRAALGRLMSRADAP